MRHVHRAASRAALALALSAAVGLAGRAGSQTVDARAANGAARRGRVVTDTFWSQSLGVRKEVVVYLPPSYASAPARRFPVAYYLHGLGGAQWDWVRLGHLDAAMDSLIASGTPEMIVVMPDGDDGWYTTWNTLGGWRDCVEHPPAREPAASYCVPWPHYDDYIARDLVAHVDSTLRTEPDRAHRGIGGLSMGGLGAIALALAYPDVFSAAASHSGVLSPMYVGPHPFDGHPRYATSTDELQASAGRLWPSLRPALGADTSAWAARDPAHLARRLLAARPGLMPGLFMDVGRDDGLADQSRALDAELTRLGVTHAYAEWPGRHQWVYWEAHVGESLAWMAARIAR